MAIACGAVGGDDAAVAESMTAVLETHDLDLLLLALGDVARARGMAQVAKDAGLGRESLYKALAPGALRYGPEGCPRVGAYGSRHTRRSGTPTRVSLRLAASSE